MFVSIFFLVFLIVLWGIYVIMPPKLRKGTLLLFSYIFCGYISINALIVLLITTIGVYLMGISIEKGKDNKEKAKSLMLMSVVVLAFILVVYKNIPYAIKMFNIEHLKDNILLTSIVLPVGFSFYAFSCIAYICDVWTGKEKAERKFVDFALFTGFFAKLVSGPIERNGRFSEQIKNLVNVKVIDADRLHMALTQIVWGYFLKLVIADRLAMIVDRVYYAPVIYHFTWLIMAAVFYSFQIYADFAGYTYIAMGCANLFGIELSQNFDKPYCSKTITEFWRKWHMSLSSWLKDYVYIPLGGNRKGVAIKCINTMIVFLLCGIWHGSGLSFVMWGLLHGLYSVVDTLRKKSKESRIKNGIQRLVTFIAVTFAWIFFRAESLKEAFAFIKMMVTNRNSMATSKWFFEEAGLSVMQIYIGGLFIILLWIIDMICESKATDIPKMVNEKTSLRRYIFFYICIILIFVFGIYGGEFNSEKFIYMQF